MALRILKWVLLATLVLLAAALVIVVFLWGAPLELAALLLAGIWLALLAALLLGARRHSRRAVFAAATGFLLVAVFAGGSVLWSISSSYHLAGISPRLLAGAAPPVSAFVDVNLVPMDSERVVPHQTVIIRDGWISIVGPTETTTVPREAVKIDGRGKYLMPGLTDMHAHIIFGLDDPLLFVANGVTAVRNMGSYAPLAFQVIPNLPYRSHTDLRDQIAQGRLVGPRFYLEPGPIEDAASPFVRHQSSIVQLLAPLFRVVSSPAEAARQVEGEQREGYRNVKTYTYVRADEYAALVAAAQQRGMKIIGHVPRSVPIAAALSSGQWLTIEHLSGYLHPCGGLKIAPGEIARYAELTAAAGVWNVPTLAALVNVPPPEARAPLLARPEMAYVHPYTSEVWRASYAVFDQLCAETTPARYPSQNLGQAQALLRGFHNAGAGILLGSDAGFAYVVPGFSIHDELRLLAQAGLTPYEALRAGTYNAALVLDALHESGTVAPGKRADLLLLERNPLADVANVRQRSGVMAQGRWFTAGELDAALAELAAAYR